MNIEEFKKLIIGRWQYSDIPQFIEFKVNTLVMNGHKQWGYKIEAIGEHIGILIPVKSVCWIIENISNDKEFVLVRDVDTENHIDVYKVKGRFTLRSFNFKNSPAYRFKATLKIKFPS